MLHNLKSDLLKELYERGFIYQLSNLENLDQLLYSKKIKAYIGFDCTADSLHVGSLMQIMLLKHLQNYGHTPFALLGGGTSLIGDPSGKDKSRKMLSISDIETNKIGIKKVLSKFINFQNTSDNTAVLLDNAEWLTNFKYLDFLRDYGDKFTINRMLTFDSVKSRLEREQPLTFLEFNYMILQAVDFLYLNKNYNVVLQLGGSDQWGNIINGIDLIRKLLNQEAFALTSPLITNSSGNKMGKTEKGAVWLSDEKITPWDYYQFWRNVSDEDTIKFLKIFTMIDLKEINKLSTLKGNEINDAKKILAFETTSMCFGEKEAKKAMGIAKNTFEDKSLSEDLPTYFVTENKPLIDFLLENNIFTSKSEIRRLIQNKGIKINSNTISDYNYMINKTLLANSDFIKLSLGKKNHILIKVI